MAEQFPNYGGYVYTFNNPVNLTDPTGMAPEDIIPKVFIYSAITRSYILQNNRLTIEFLKAVKEFNSTSEGSRFIKQFMKRGQNFAGINAVESGIYSNYDLHINDVNISDGGERGAYWGTTEALFRPRIDESNRNLYFEANFDTRYDIGTLLENLGHELFIHGYKVDEIIDFYKKNGSEATQEAIDNNFFSGRNDHKSLRDKDSNHKGYRIYESFKNKMSIKNSNYEKAFKDAEQKYKEGYKDL